MRTPETRYRSGNSTQGINQHGAHAWPNDIKIRPHWTQDCEHEEESIVHTNQTQWKTDFIHILQLTTPHCRAPLEERKKCHLPTRNRHRQRYQGRGSRRRQHQQRRKKKKKKATWYQSIARHHSGGEEPPYHTGMYAARFSPTLLRAPGSLLLKKRTQKTESCATKKKKEVKNEAEERCEKAKNACSFYWIQSSLQRRQGEGREAGRTRCKKSNNAESAANANNNTTAPIPAPRMEFRKRRSFQVGTGTWIMLANIKYDINICFMS